MLNQGIQLLCVAMLLLIASCRKDSDKKPNGENPVMPFVSPSADGLTEKECSSKARELLNGLNPKDIQTVPQNLRTEVFILAMAVSSGKLETKCLDYSYQTVK